MLELAHLAFTVLGVVNLVNFCRSMFAHRRLRPNECWLFAVMFIGYLPLNVVDGDAISAAFDLVGVIAWSGLAVDPSRPRS